MTEIKQKRLLKKLATAILDGKMVKETLYRSVAMYYLLQDESVPRKVKIEIIAALLYLLNPLDLLPDLLSIGLVDDIALLGYTWNVVKQFITEEHRQAAKATVLELLGRLNLTQEVSPGDSSPLD